MLAHVCAVPRPAHRAPRRPLDSISKLLTRSRVNSHSTDSKKSRTTGPVRPRRAHQGSKGSALGAPCLTSDACCARGGPAHSDGLFARKTENAPFADLYSNDFFSCISQNYLPAPVSGFESETSSGSGTWAASGRGTCSPWTSGSSSPWSLCREHLCVPVLVGSHSCSVSGSATWTRQTWSHCHFFCEEGHCH